MASLEERNFEEIAAQCEAILEDLENDIEKQKRWNEVLRNARSNKGVLGL